MRLTRTRRIIIAGATAGAVLLTGGVAFAFWSSTGTTAGAAEVAADATELTVTQIGTPSGLFPGGPAANIVAKVDNPSATDILLDDVTVTVTGVVDSGGAAVAGCLTADFVIEDTVYAGELILAGDTTGNQTVSTIRLVNTAANQDPCKGASVVLSLVAS